MCVCVCVCVCVCYFFKFYLFIVEWLEGDRRWVYCFLFAQFGFVVVVLVCLLACFLFVCCWVFYYVFVVKIFASIKCDDSIIK